MASGVDLKFDFDKLTAANGVIYSAVNYLESAKNAIISADNNIDSRLNASENRSLIGAPDFRATLGVSYAGTAANDFTSILNLGINDSNNVIETFKKALGIDQAQLTLDTLSVINAETQAATDELTTDEIFIASKESNKFKQKN